MNDAPPPSPSEYESKQIRQITAWKARRPGLVARATQTLLHPVGWTFQKIIPRGAIEGALHGTMWLADQWAVKQKVLTELEANSFADLSDFDLVRLDKTADNIHDWAIAYGASAGGGFGAAGFILAPIGIASAINIALRTIRMIALCYGYDDLNEHEKIFIFQILALVGGNSQSEKTASLLALREIQVTVLKKTFRKMAEIAAEDKLSKEAFIIAIREFSKKIGIQLTKDRILMLVPLIGGGVGLLVDGNYIRNVGWVARYVYQERWLRDQGRWPAELDA